MERQVHEKSGYFRPPSGYFRPPLVRRILVISLITDKRQCTTQPTILSINDGQVEVNFGNLVLAYSVDS